MPEPIIIRLRKDIPKKGSLEPSLISGCEHILMPQAGTYALGVEAIREAYKNNECQLQPLYAKPDGSRIVRPLTFRENIEARVNGYNTLNNPDGSERTNDERLRLFARYLDSCTGIAYKAGTTKFKIVHQSLDLIEIPSEFKEWFLAIDYDLIDGTELDSSKEKYNNPLTLSQVKSHPAWLAAVEDDKSLLSEYADIVFSLLNEKYKRTEGMGFYVRQNTETDELWALFVNYVSGNSGAYGGYYLYNDGSFLRVAPSQNFSTGSEGK